MLLLDVQIHDFLGMRLDELLTRRNRTSHQHIEGFIDAHAVLDLDLHERPPGRVHGRVPELIRVHLTETLVALNLRPLAQLLDCRLALLFGVRPDLFLATLHPVERWLRDVEVAVVNELLEMPVEEGQKQRSDMRAIDVGIGHDDDPVVAQFADVELIAHRRAERRDQRADLVVLQDLVQPRLFDVQDLASQREDRLEAAIATLLGRSTGRVALDNVELCARRIPLGAVGQLARQAEALEATLALDQLAGLAGRLAGACRRQALVDDPLGGLRVLLDEGAEGLVDNRLHRAGDLGVAELALGLSLELRLGELHRDDRGQSFTDVFARERLVVLQEAVLLAVVVDRAGQRRLEAGKMRAAIARVDVVRECVRRLAIAVVVLKRDLDHARRRVPEDIERPVVNGSTVPVDVAHERDDTALEVEGHLLIITLVAQRQPEPLGQVGSLAEPLHKCVVVVLEARDEDRGVGQESGRRAALVLARRSDHLDRRVGNAALVGLLVDLAVAPNLDLHPVGERVDDGRADAMETARDLVSAAAELASAVEDGHDYFEGRFVHLRMLVDRDTAPVVDDRHDAVGADGAEDVIAVAAERLVNRVVDDLADQVMQASVIGAADVHTRTPSYRLESLEDLD